MIELPAYAPAVGSEFRLATRKFDGGLVEAYKPAIGVSRIDRRRERVDSLAKAPLTRAQRLLSLFSLGDVHHHSYRSDKFPHFIMDRAGIRQNSQPGSVIAFDHHLTLVVFLVILDRQRHPALIAADRRSVSRIKPE